MAEPWERDWSIKPEPQGAPLPPGVRSRAPGKPDELDTPKEPWERDWGPKAAPEEGTGELTWTGHAPPTNVREGVTQIGRDIAKAGGMVYDEFGRINQNLGRMMERLQQGDLTGAPETVTPLVAAAINPAAYGSGAAGRAAMMAARAPGANFPKYAATEVGTKAAGELAGVPGMGKPIREAADRGIASYEKDLLTAHTKATEEVGKFEGRVGDAVQDLAGGGAVDFNAAMKNVQRAAREEYGFLGQKGAGVNPYIASIGRMQNPDHIAPRLIELAGTGKIGNPQALASLRQNINSTDWGHVQASIFAALGHKKGGFDPVQALTRYEKELSDAGRNVIFGASRARNTTRASIEQLVADNKAMDEIRRVAAGAERGQGGIPKNMEALGPQVERMAGIPRTVTGEGAVKGLILSGWALASPMTALATATGGRLTAQMLSKPQVAGPLASWSQAYVNFHRSGGGPAAYGALIAATNALNDETGLEIEPARLIETMRNDTRPQQAEQLSRPVLPGQPRQPSPPVDRDQLSRDRDFDSRSGTIGDVVRFGAKLTPKGVPTEHMRESTNIERRPEARDELEPFADLMYRNTPPDPRVVGQEAYNNWVRIATELAEKGQTVAREHEYNYKPNLPRNNPMSQQAGLADLEAVFEQRKRSGERSYGQIMDPQGQVEKDEYYRRLAQRYPDAVARAIREQRQIGAPETPPTTPLPPPSTASMPPDIRGALEKALRAAYGTRGGEEAPKRELPPLPRPKPKEKKK